MHFSFIVVSSFCIIITSSSSFISFSQSGRLPSVFKICSMLNFSLMLLKIWFRITQICLILAFYSLLLISTKTFSLVEMYFKGIVCGGRSSFQVVIMQWTAFIRMILFISLVFKFAFSIKNVIFFRKLVCFLILKVLIAHRSTVRIIEVQLHERALISTLRCVAVRLHVNSIIHKNMSFASLYLHNLFNALRTRGKIMNVIQAFHFDLYFTSNDVALTFWKYHGFRFFQITSGLIF